MTGGWVQVRRDGGLAELIVDKPKGNVFDAALMGELRLALGALHGDPDLKLIALCAAGPNFSFGASVEEHRPAQAAAMLATFHALCRDLVRCPVPVAAVVQGRCLGGAFEVALACHFVFATADARFACPEIQLGVFPPVLAAIGHLRLGGALAERLLLTGAELDAAQGERCGFITAIVPTDDPRAAVRAWYDKALAPLSAFAVRQATRAARRGSGLLDAIGAGLGAAERQYLDDTAPSADGQEGIEAFLARRKPSWVHR